MWNEVLKSVKTNMPVCWAIVRRGDTEHTVKLFGDKIDFQKFGTVVEKSSLYVASDLDNQDPNEFSPTQHLDWFDEMVAEDEVTAFISECISCADMIESRYDYMYNLRMGSEKYEDIAVTSVYDAYTASVEAIAFNFLLLWVAHKVLNAATSAS